MDLIDSRLHWSDLRGSDLRWADLRRSDLDGANLKGADLGGATLRGADLKSADLRWAALSGADLNEVSLSEADVRGGDLRRASLRNAVLANTNLENAQIGWTVFGDVDLSSVEGLETVTHIGPSTIGIDTIYNSQGKIPEAFLRGCGVPDEMIEFSKSLFGKAIEFYSCFISYSSKDEEFAKRLHADLQDNGVRCWFAPHNIKAGEKLEEQIDQAIRLYDKLLLIVSENSIGSSWVETEIRKARKRERNEDRRMLFPIGLQEYDKIREWKLYDADEGRDLAAEIREYFIPDFSNWKDHDSYKIAFDRLLRDLKGETDVE